MSPLSQQELEHEGDTATGVDERSSSQNVEFMGRVSKQVVKKFSGITLL